MHKVKFDGYRLQVRIEGSDVRLLTREGHDWTGRFGEPLLSAFAALPCRIALLDGEVVIENAAGVSDFSAPQGALSAGEHTGFCYYAFDLIYLDGKDLREESLLVRKEVLQRLLDRAAQSLRFSSHFENDGQAVLRHVCRLSLEGIVSKQKDAPYRSGRSKSWLKSKCTQRQELVIAGYVPSSVSRMSIGSLVLGYYDEGNLTHAGRAGTGYSAAIAHRLFEILQALRQEHSPFPAKLKPAEARGVVFVAPERVAEIEFRGWTADHHLRHASFRGLREDKQAKDVVREDATMPVIMPRSAITVTHPERIYWPDAGVTKAALAEYYADVFPRMAFFTVYRPLALLRCPDGIGGQCFFQKHAWNALPSAIHQTERAMDSSGKAALYITDADGLVALVQGGVLEIHPWGARLDDLERPDLITMDLDPGEGVSWRAIIETAQEVRARLDAAGLHSFVKTSGGKGLHVVAPLQPAAGWDQVKAFTKAVAEEMAADSPGKYVSKVTKSKRRGKILIDYLRNGRGATAVAPYSTRARAGAPVAMPLAWDELESISGPAAFTVANARQRLSADDPWAGFAKAAVRLPGKTKRGRR